MAAVQWQVYCQLNRHVINKHAYNHDRENNVTFDLWNFSLFFYILSHLKNLCIPVLVHALDWSLGGLTLLLNVGKCQCEM